MKRGVARQPKSPRRARSTPAAAPAPPAPRVAVRMYRQGLGDCFLVSFRKAAGGSFHMLIDCGVIVGQVPGRPSIKEVAEHIGKTTGDHLDLLVLTHQHWDHLSGFIDAAGVFKRFQVDQLWLAWTEDPKDRLAAELAEKRRKAEKVLRSVALRFGRSPAGSDGAWAGALDGVLGFMGAAGAGSATEAALKAARGLCPASPRYCRPDDPPLALAGVEDVRVYVLGPPHDAAKIRRYNDSKVDPETYRLSQLAIEAQADFMAAALDTTQQGDDSVSRYPFDGRQRIVRSDPRFAALDKKGFGGAEAWRRIDLDWLRATGGMALALDNATNNTSLALAIELGARGKVLLFPGDAQVGNWLSWHDQTWKDAGGPEVTAADLLARTALYKVGHHCSHNATLRQRGLDLMTSDELVAMVPLDRKTAKKKDWVMPWPALRKGLLAATKGRILQVDDASLPAKRPCPEGTDPSVWKEFQGRVSGDPLYVEIDIP